MPIYTNGSSCIFVRCLRPWRNAVVVLALALAACGSDSAPSRDSAPSIGNAPGIVISANLNQPFKLAVHDYTIDCTTSPMAELVVVAPQAIGFTFLGTTGIAGAVLHYDPVRFRLAMTLASGQGFRFAVAATGSYSFRCLPPDFPVLTVEPNGTPQSEWYLFSIASYTIMTDSHGTPVWWMSEHGSSSVDAKVFGTNQIGWAPFSGGTFSLSGTYVIRDFSGHILNTLVGNLDFHDMQLTPSGTYLGFRYVYRVCQPDCADMSPWGGGTDEGVMDAEILEMDRNSNVLWIWKTRDHIALSETGEAGWYPAVGEDLIHMNSIAPDGADGLIFSARHLNAIYHVTKSTGAIDWKIGGTPRAESLTVIGDPRPTAVGTQILSGQHDARIWPDGTVSVHDNGVLPNRAPAVVRYRIDTVQRTAEVIEVVQDARVLQAGCCGAARLLPGGNWLVDWGQTTFITELQPDGNPVFTINPPPNNFSYRAIPVPPGTISADALRDGMDAMTRS